MAFEDAASTEAFGECTKDRHRGNKKPRIVLVIKAALRLRNTRRGL